MLFQTELTPRLGITPKQVLPKNINCFLSYKNRLQIASQFVWTVLAKSITFCQKHNKHYDILLWNIFQNINNPASTSQKWMLCWTKSFAIPIFTKQNRRCSSHRYMDMYTHSIHIRGFSDGTYVISTSIENVYSNVCTVKIWKNTNESESHYKRYVASLGVRKWGTCTECKYTTFREQSFTAQSH